MFGSAPTFSELVQEFDARLDQLSWNDGNSISYLTNRARAAPPSDVDILTTCILFRIITNPPTSKVPVIYLMDSMVKNSGPAFGPSFERHIGALLPAVFDTTTSSEARSKILRLTGLWAANRTFRPELVSRIEEEMKKSEQRRAVKPVPSGWPAILPSGSEQLPQIELKIADYLYRSIFPLLTPTEEELNFTKDSLAVLIQLLKQFNDLLGRPQDPEIDPLLSNYDFVVQMRRKLAMESVAPAFGGGRSATPLAAPQPLPQVHNQPSTMDNGIHYHANVAQNYADIGHPPTTQSPSADFVKSAPAQRSAPPRISLSDPRSLTTYNQAAIDVLYHNLPFRCSMCGLRFATQDEWKDHADWHYTERTTLQSRVSGAQTGRGHKLQRQWFFSAKEWVETCGGTKRQVSSNLANQNGASSTNTSALSETKQIVRFSDTENEAKPICAACGEDIETPEYDDLGWFYPNTVRGSDGKLYHVKCFSDTLPNNATLTSSLESPLKDPTQKKRPANEDEGFDELDLELPPSKRLKTEDSD